jgi:RNA polymerase sigma-70 factor (ECF subfamily)
MSFIEASTNLDRKLNVLPSGITDSTESEFDSGLVVLIRRDPHRGSKILFERYSRSIELALFRVLGQDSEIADLVHDVFLAALDSIQELQKTSALRSWLIGIAINKARNLVRRRKAHPLMIKDGVCEILDQGSFPSKLDTNDALRRTYRLLLRLPTEERLAFTLKRIHGLELTEIAKKMCISVATVKRRTVRAQRIFVKWAKCDDVLTDWLERGNLRRS